MRRLNIDIGGTKIKAVLLENGEIAASSKEKTPKTKKEFIETLRAAVKKMAGGKEIKSVGVGVAGVVKRNRVVFSPNIPYLKNFDFRAVFPRFPLKVDNDARVLLMNELKFDAGGGNKKAMIFTVGTGIGRAFAKNGKVLKIKKLEEPEKWEKEYQRARNRGTAAVLADFLAERFAPIVKKYKPETVFFGGGVLKKKNFFPSLKKKLEKKIDIMNGARIKFKKTASRF